MSDLTGAVAKTMNFVFADINSATNDKKKRLATLKANIGKVVTLPLDEIQTDENIRHNIDENSHKFLQLVESVKKYGILENIVVQLVINKKETDYSLVCIAGHRRILAAKKTANINKIPCLIVAYEKKGDKVGAALAENLSREDLHCLDVAIGYQDLLDNGWDEEDIAKHFCRDIRTIKHYVKMASWPSEVKEIIRQNEEAFSTRILMRQFAYKKFNSPSELTLAIKNFLSPVVRQNKKPLKKSEHFDQIKIKSSLDKYLSKQNTLSILIKDEIKKAFMELGLI